MDPMEMVTDRCIRRGLGLAGLAIAMVMVGLSFDLALALRSGGELIGLTAVVLLMAAWAAPRRDLRSGPAWSALNYLVPEVVRGRPRREIQRRLQEVLRQRLLWHAKRVGLLALGVWTLGLLALTVRAFRAAS